MATKKTNHRKGARKAPAKKSVKVALRPTRMSDAEKSVYYANRNRALFNRDGEVPQTMRGMGHAWNREKDEMYRALPAGWRKSVTGRWYFENRKNRTDDRVERNNAWSQSMSPAQKQKAYKHLVAVESKALMDETGNPHYVRYIVKYNDFHNNPYVTHNRARAKLVNRLAIKQGKKATNPSALYLNNREYVARHKGYHIVGNQVIKNKDYSDIAAYRDLVERRISKKGGRSKRTGYVSIPSIVAPVKKSTTRKASNKGRKPSTRKSTPKVAPVLFVDARTTKKAPVKKATPKAKGRKTSAKKSRR